MSNHLAHKKMLPQGFDTIFRWASTLNLVINDSKTFASDDILSSCAKIILVSEKKTKTSRPYTKIGEKHLVGRTGYFQTSRLSENGISWLLL